MSQVKKGAGRVGEENAREAELAREIKSFRKTFKSEHGRDPSRKDMNKFPEIAKAYDAWLAIKSNSMASTSALPSSSSSAVSSKPGISAVSKRKADASATGDSPRKKKGPLYSTKDNSSTQASESTMAPPPTTPSKEKRHKKVTYEPMVSSSSAFVTPTKKAKAASLSSIASPTAGIHDSGGSIIDVPSTPRSGDGRGGRGVVAGTSPLSPSASRSSQGQHQRHTRQTSRTYESPSKIRALLSSFSSIHRTPTKDSSRTEDAQIMQRLTKGPLPAYTPRTKARKRLRGEVVVTPEKKGISSSSGEGVDNIAGHLGGSGALQARSQLPPQKKKRRGMATNTNTSTLRDYGIIPVAGPKARSSDGQGQHDRREEQPRGGEKFPQLNAAGFHSTISQRDDIIDASDGNEDEEEGDDMLGPSPSANRVVNRPIKSFQPLFGLSTGDVAAAVDDDMAEEEEDEVAKVTNKPTEAKKKDDDEAMQGGETILDDGEDSNIIVVPYRPYGRNNSYQRRGAAFSDEEEEEDEHEDRDDVGLHFYDRIAPGFAQTFGPGMEIGSPALSDDGDADADTAHPILDNLSLNSPQMKKARQYQRTKNERNIRNLLGRDDKLQPLDDWEEQQQEQQQGGQQKNKGITTQPKTNKVGPSIKGGKLRKGFKDLKSNISSNTRLTKESTEMTSSSKLVLQNSRDQLGSDEESDVGNRSDYDGKNDDDDEWASDVGSAEYGLGDGYMSDL